MDVTRNAAIAALCVIPYLPSCSRAQASETQTPTPAVPVRVQVVRDEFVGDLYRASATLRGRNTAVLTSRTLGYVKSVSVKAGDLVKAGQELALLDAKDSEASVRRARASLDAAHQARVEAESGITAAQANALYAVQSQKRVKGLVGSDALAAEQLDEAEARHTQASAQLDMAKARRDAARSRIQEAEAALAEASANLAYARITAPFDGRVVERRMDPGNLASPGAPLLVVEQVGPLRAEAIVEESLAGRIHEGDKAAVELDTIDHPLTGSVTELVAAVDTASRAFLVKVELPEQPAGSTLRAGMFARVSFQTGQSPRRVIAKTALQHLGQLDRVFVVQDHRARLRIVSVGEARDPWIEVLSGIDQGEVVVANPPIQLTDGQLVSVEP